MITVRVRIYPKLDKVAEVRDFLAAWVKRGQEQGEQSALAQRIFTSEGPMLMIPRRYDDLAAADARRHENLADSGWQERLATLSTMIREPIRQSIEESVVPMATPIPNPGIIRRAFFYPAVEHAPDYRARLAEVVQTGHAQGRGRVALAQQVFSEAGPVLVVTTTHPDMADLDRVRRERAADVQALITSLAGISRAPVAVRLLEGIVPFPR
jgi:hypothetical protein